MKCYYYTTTCTDPYRNLATEELLLRVTGPDEVILYLWQNKNTVVIGRNQNAWRECKIEAFSAQKGQLARRLSGGGAVYHDLGNQNFTFLAQNKLYDVKRQTKVICEAVRAFGIHAVQSGRNDILSEGRKFSGNAFHRMAYASYHHGTILIDSDLSKLSQFLVPSKEKLEEKGIQSVRDRVINLNELNADITPEAMREALLHAFGEEYGVAVQKLPEDKLDLNALDKLAVHYADKDWCLGRLMAEPVKLRKRFSFGELEFLFKLKNGMIKKAYIHSDAMDAVWVKKLEAALHGKAFSAVDLARSVPENMLSPQAKREVVDYLLTVLA